MVVGLAWVRGDWGLFWSGLGDFVERLLRLGTLAAEGSAAGFAACYDPGIHPGRG